LDRTRRGFETFARECFEALRDNPEIAIRLAKGTGKRRHGELLIPALARDGVAARRLAKLTSREPFVVEHVTFAVALLPVLARRRPDVVYFSEWHVGRVLAAWRRLSRQSFALVFCNGALMAEGYGHLDLVQQLVPGAIEYVVERGGTRERQTLLPLGVAIESSPKFDKNTRETLRRRLALPTDRRIVLSAGAIGHQKRMDHLVGEIASMPEPRPFLLLMGQQDAETQAIRKLAQERLGADGHDIRTVPPEAMADHYRASDVFVLASLWESFGRVLVEAQSHGLPCLAHDYPVMKWLLGEEGETTDLRRQGSVASWLRGLTAADFSDARARRRHRAAYARFSWDVLVPSYVEMLRQAAQARRAR
jgi:glycosyltransferase involved in cell wall biosynthesis